MWLWGYTEPYSTSHRMDALPKNNKAYVILHILGVMHSELRAREAGYKGQALIIKIRGGGRPKTWLWRPLNIAVFKKILH